MQLKDWLRNKVLGLTGLAKYDGVPDDDRLTFINDEERLMRTRIREYDIWYEGDGDELLNFYTHQNAIDYNYEPFYTRNKKNYFWAISSTETDIKRTHSGQPRNIVDTLASIVRYPTIRAGKLESDATATNENLQRILKENNVRDLHKSEQMPLTLVEGWGCYKIDWDLDVSKYPLISYYRAENVEFIERYNRITGIIFKNYYTNGKKRYMLAETRSLRYDEELKDTVLIIQNELFEATTDIDYVKPIYDFSEVPALEGTEPYAEIGPCHCLFAVPCIYFRNTSKICGPGRSIFTGKIDLFDDLDQCLSQASNSVRASTPIEYINSEYLERDRNGLPKQPHAYDRKYSIYQGQKNVDGSSTGDPVQVTQPQINFQQYSDQAVQILMQIIDGVMSPATLGIDIAKRDNAEAQREKEKVTIFTRNSLIDTDTEIQKSLCSQSLVAYEFMTTGKITVQEYDISVKYSEFADDSYENKLEKLGAAYNDELISDEMFMQKLYGDSLSRADYNRELSWLKEHHTKPRDEGMLGAGGDGANEEGGMAAMMGALAGGDEEEL